MVFTFFHASISFLLFYPLRQRFEIFAFLLGAMLPDIESLYYGLRALERCGNNYICLAEYPSHQLLHSFLGVLLLAMVSVFIVKKFREYMKFKVYKMKTLYLSAVFGGLTHLFVDSTIHKGADALALFYPIDLRFSFVFSNSLDFWNLIGLIGFIAFLYLWKDRFVV